VAEFDAFVQRTLQTYEVPGVAVGLVLDGQPALLRGYGVRQVGEAAPVDAETVFQLASVTKAFTAAALGSLVDEGQVAWDEPTINYLPELVLYDPYATQNVTLRDFLAHRSGLPSFGGDLLGQLGYERTEIVRRVRFIEPKESFREEAAYSNMGYFLAGEVGARRAGAPWNDLVTNRLIVPLGMSRTGTSIAERPADGNVSANHAVIDGRLQVIPREGSDAIGAANSMSASATDVVQFLQMLLGGGQLDGRQVLSSATVESLYQPSMVAEPGFTEMPPIGRDTGFAYSLGWGVFDYGGYRVLEKGGAVGGVRTIVMLVPEKQLGLVVLANRNITALPEAVRAEVLDRFVAPSGRDLQGEIRERQTRLEGMFAAATAPPSPTPLSRPLDTYTGTYENELYGRFTVVRDGEGLRVDAGPRPYPGALTHLSDDTFALKWPSVTTIAEDVTFVLGTDGRASEMEIETLGRFRRVPAS
jgi:CubicO group peptidase (beta-lactamase class C family)